MSKFEFSWFYRVFTKYFSIGMVCKKYHALRIIFIYFLFHELYKFHQQNGKKDTILTLTLPCVNSLYYIKLCVT